MTLQPAYSRDYKSQKEVLEDWNANKDFIITDIGNRWCGKPVNKTQLDGQEVLIRYNKLRKIMRVK